MGGPGKCHIFGSRAPRLTIQASAQPDSHQPGNKAEVHDSENILGFPMATERNRTLRITRHGQLQLTLRNELLANLSIRPGKRID